MDVELLELQRQFEFAQQAKSSIRLSERNVVELLQKLQELHIIDFDLLHTVSGKEFITPEKLRNEILTEVQKLGRVTLIDVADTTSVDLYHVEKQAQLIVADDPALTLIQGEIISQTYWDNVAEEINERLQECSQIALAEVSLQLQVGSELVASMLETRLGTLVKGRLEGGQLYTPAYVARVSSMVRGAARGITVPTNLSVLWSSLQKLLHEMDGASGVYVESMFFQSLFNGQIKEGALLGSLRAGVQWTPTVFANAQMECIDSFFSQNSFIRYQALNKLGISQPLQFLQSRYPEGIPLVTVFAHSSMIEMLDSATEYAIEHGSWIDSLSLLPASFGSQNASKILSLCPSIQSVSKAKANNAVIMAESYVFSNHFLKDIYAHMEKEMDTLSLSAFSGVIQADDSLLVKDAKGNLDFSNFVQLNETNDEIGLKKQRMEKESKKKKGKSAGSVKTAPVESGSDNQDFIPPKSRKSRRKDKDASSLQISDSKSGAKKDVIKMQEDNAAPSEEWVMQKVIMLVPELEEQDDPEMVIKSLAGHLRPMLIQYLKERRKSLLTDNAEKMKRLLDNLQKRLDESFLNLQLYGKALDLFEDDQSTFVVLHRHLLRTTAASIVDMLFLNLDLQNKLKHGIQVEDSQNLDSVSLNSGERIALAKSFTGSLSKKALAVNEAVEGRQVETFVSIFTDLAEESGLHLKKLDKKLERILLHSYRKDCTSQVSAESDPVALLPKVISLLYVQAYNKALQAPGRAISSTVSRLKDKLDDSAYKCLIDYHSATVALLSLISAATGDDKDCSADRIMSKREHLESLIPALKGLVLSTRPS